MIAAAPEAASVRGLVLDGGGMVDVDLMGCETLSEVYEALCASGGGDDVTFPDAAIAADRLMTLN